MDKRKIYVAVEDKGDDILLVVFKDEDLYALTLRVERWEKITGRKLTITIKVDRR